MAGFLGSALSKSKYDYVIIGAGIIGLCVARALRARDADARILIIEKEGKVAEHASGRNSGVLHAGFYYSADSLKARFTRQGNLALQRFCDDYHLPINRCGKLVVAQKPHLVDQLDILLERARLNGVPLEKVSRAEAQGIEPRIKLSGDFALWSPSTASVNPVVIVEKLAELAQAEGIELRLGCPFGRPFTDGVTTDGGEEIFASYIINCAGLYADHVAKHYGFSRSHRILPFKGLYLYSNEGSGSLKTNIYPVPDLRNPFLGVHFTVTVKNEIKIGPTAIPALWREQYHLLTGFKFGEFSEISWRQLELLIKSDFNFRAMAWDEVKKFFRRHLVALAGELADKVDAKDYQKWGRPGIRAQLINLKTKKLEMDFVGEGDQRSYHVLNCVSPAFTCCMPLADHIVDEVFAKQGRT